MIFLATRLWLLALKSIQLCSCNCIRTFLWLLGLTTDYYLLLSHRGTTSQNWGILPSLFFREINWKPFSQWKALLNTIMLKKNSLNQLYYIKTLIWREKGCFSVHVKTVIAFCITFPRCCGAPWRKLRKFTLTLFWQKFRESKS